MQHWKHYFIVLVISNWCFTFNFCRNILMRLNLWLGLEWQLATFEITLWLWNQLVFKILIHIRTKSFTSRWRGYIFTPIWFYKILPFHPNYNNKIYKSTKLSSLSQKDPPTICLLLCGSVNFSLNCGYWRGSLVKLSI